MTLAQRRRVAWRDAPLQYDDLFEASRRWTAEPKAVLDELSLDVSGVATEEFERVQSRLERRATDVTPHFPTKFGLGGSSQALLYALVRSVRPESVVETGVADGWSTAVILAAMDANGVGVLHSIDIDLRCGGLVEAAHPRWHRHITDGSLDQLEEIVAGLPALDLFLHDSDHSYMVQTAEYVLAERAMSDGGLLVSDDVNWSNAFLDFCLTRGLEPIVLADVTKIVGVVRLSSPSGTRAPMDLA